MYIAPKGTTTVQVSQEVARIGSYAINVTLEGVTHHSIGRSSRYHLQCLETGEQVTGKGHRTLRAAIMDAQQLDA